MIKERVISWSNGFLWERSNKVIGLMDILVISEEALKANIGFVFGDDPLGGDRNLLEIAPYPYVIKNETHRYLDLLIA